MDGRLIRPLGEHPFIIMSKRFNARFKAFYYTSRLHRLRLKGKQPLKLTSSPKDPWEGEVHIGAQLLTGVFSHGGYSHTASDDKPWPNTAHPPEIFYSWLHSFSWLRDLELIADRSLAQEKAETLLTHWLEHNKRWSASAWRPELIGERIVSWMFHAPLILSNTDLVYRSTVMHSLLQQARHLRYVVATAPIGVPRIKASVGLAISGLLIPDGEDRLNKGLKVLEKTLNKFVLPDGGVSSRNPRDAMITLKHLITLMVALDNQNRDRPNWLQFSCDKLVPFLRALSHGDGGFAHFGGSFASDSHGLDRAIKLSDAKGRASNNLPFTGYQRLKKNRTLVLFNTGTPPEPALSRAMPANALAMELSDGKDRLIVGVGGTYPGFAEDENNDTGASAQYWSRKTCAHSTVTVGRLNSSTVLKDEPIPTEHFEALFDRNENEDGVWVDAVHDGYEKKYKIGHTRRLFLNNDGTDFRGEDTVERDLKGFAKLFTPKELLPVKLRFHIHPSVSLSANQKGNAIILRLPHGHGWIFHAKGGHMRIEDSVYSDKAEDIKKTSQIVIEGRISTNQTLQIKWSFKRMDKRE